MSELQHPAPGADIELCAAGAAAAPSTDLNAVPIPDITSVLQALADPVRIAIVRRLGECEDARACGSLDLPVSKSTPSHPFKALREAGPIHGLHEGTRQLSMLPAAARDPVYPARVDN